jgi:p-aminobenzoyl-glutamate transporter AbgT
MLRRNKINPEDHSGHKVLSRNIINKPYFKIFFIKIIVVGIVWILGLIIDKISEPKFLRLAPAASEEPSPAFVSIKNRHLALEIIAALVFYIIIVMGVLL